MINFKQHFAPAYTLQESEEQLTTQELYDKFMNLTYDPGFTVDLMHDLLTENGFRYDYIMDEFRWLLRIIR